MGYRIGDTIFNDWEIVRKIGEGASGIVFEVKKRGQDIPLLAAVKVIYVPKDESVTESYINEGFEPATVTTYLQNVVDELTDEIKIMASMKGFPYVVSCEDYSVVKKPSGHEWEILIRMELLTSLQAYQKNRTITEAEVWKLGTQLAEALALFEERGIIHRDIKPANIFVNEFGDYKIGDFGIARVCDKTTGVMSKKGTENYMAPEVYRGQEYNQTVDIYSLGLVLYKLLNHNRLPFYPTERPTSPGDIEKALGARLSGKKELPPPEMASPDMARIILKMCRFYPEERYQNASELLRDLRSVFVSERPVSASGQTGTPLPHEETAQSDQNGSDVTNLIFTDFQNSGNSRNIEPVQRPEEDVSEIPMEPEEEQDEEEACQDPDEKEPADWLNQIDLTGDSDTLSFGRSKRNYKKIAGYSALVLAALAFLVISLLRSRTFSLTVNNGTGSGDYKGKEQVSIKADEKEGQYFSNWTADGIDLTDSEKASPTLKITMPRRNVTLTACYEDVICHVVVNKGSGTGDYVLNEKVDIKADETQEGYHFDKWITNVGSPAIKDAAAASTSFTVKQEEVEVTASYAENQYHLEVNNANGSADVLFGKQVTLKADEVSSHTFTGWTVTKGVLDLPDETLKEQKISFTMPACDLELTAEYAVNTHTVEVNGGKGSGTYETGEKVEITADAAPEGNQFSGWEVSEGSLTLKNIHSETTTFTMPDEDVEINALYERTKYHLTVNNADGSGDVLYGDSVKLTAEDKSGQTFAGWTIIEGEPDIPEENLKEKTITFTMPARDVELTAEYATSKHTVTINSGKGGGIYKTGDKVRITADTAPEGQHFTGWQVDEGNASLKNTRSTETVFTMPDEDVEITALYEMTEYTVLVNNGYGGGKFCLGDPVTVSADPVKNDMTFSGWTIDKGSMTLSDLNRSNFTFTMPAEDITLTAHYIMQKYTLRVTDGRGSGKFSAGDKVTVTANETNKRGESFSCWEITTGKLELSDEELSERELTFEMPDEDIVIRAKYAAAASSSAGTYHLLVNGGNGTGDYAPGTKVTITHSDPKPGMVFSHWIWQTDSDQGQNQSEEFSIMMPEKDLIVTAVFVTQY